MRKAHREIPIQGLRVDRLGGERQVDGAGRGHTLARAQLNSIDLWTGFMSLDALGDCLSEGNDRYHARARNL